MIVDELDCVHGPVVGDDYFVCADFFAPRHGEALQQDVDQPERERDGRREYGDRMEGVRTTSRDERVARRPFAVRLCVELKAPRRALPDMYGFNSEASHRTNFLSSSFHLAERSRLEIPGL
jgi:hypothetical protein